MENTGNQAFDHFLEQDDLKQKAIEQEGKEQEKLEASADYWMTIEQVCQSLNMSKQSVWRACRLGLIPHTRFINGGPINFVRKDITEFIEKSTTRA